MPVRKWGVVAAVSTIMDLTSFPALVPRTLTSTMMEAPACSSQSPPIMRVRKIGLWSVGVRTYIIQSKAYIKWVLIEKTFLICFAWFKHSFLLVLPDLDGKANFFIETNFWSYVFQIYLTRPFNRLAQVDHKVLLSKSIAVPERRNFNCVFQSTFGFTLYLGFSNSDFCTI